MEAKVCDIEGEFFSACALSLFRHCALSFSNFSTVVAAFAMEDDVFCRRKVVERGDPVVLDEAEPAFKRVENCSARNSDTSAGDMCQCVYLCSEFFSAQIESIVASRSEFETEIEFETARLKVHWSELACKEMRMLSPVEFDQGCHMTWTQ